MAKRLFSRASCVVLVCAAAACSGVAINGDATVGDAAREGSAADGQSTPDAIVSDVRAADVALDAPAPDAPAPDAAQTDAQAPDSAAPDGALSNCGDGHPDPGEQCDDGNPNDNDSCRNNCTLQCGDGVVNAAASETCDTAIASGTGACPTSCNDAMACTADLLLGSACTATCVHMPITAPAAGDGCCPPGATSSTDSDCAAVCGNSVVESGETCDTGIASGVGSCPTAAACNDAVACTTDAVSGSGCTAQCTHTPVTTPRNGDGCCPPGATAASDSDCSAACGNGVVNPPETCDTGIASGPGACPTSCNDAVACTTDALVSGGTCNAACTHTPITAPRNGDGCCPPGANATNDGDCAAVCGNRVVEMGEQCDDGNVVSGDGCSSTCQTEASSTPPTAFRITALSLVSPRVTINVLGCADITQTPFLGTSVNGEISTSISGYTLNVMSVFRPLGPASATSPLDVITNATCAAGAPATCMQSAMPAISSLTATNRATGNCFTAVAADVNTHGGTPAAYTPGVNVVNGPCFATGESTLNVNLSGIVIPLQHARVAAQYSGSPTARLVTGVVTGFLTEAAARMVTLPTTLPVVGGTPLYSHLQAGGAAGSGCNVGGGTAEDDRDLNPDGSGGRGFWFFLNFSADRATWTSP